MSHLGNAQQPNHAEHVARLTHAIADGDAPRGPHVITCTLDDHEALRTELADTLADRRPFGSLTSARAAHWLARRRPWPDADLVVGECACGSTIAIEVTP